MSGQSLMPPPPPQPMSSPDSRAPDRVALVPARTSLSQQQCMASPTAAQPGPAMHTGLLSYPPAVAKHGAVTGDRDLFFDTLNKFHAALGTKLMIPTIGGKELDLHLLYVEVTSRGGLEQVIKERKWKEVTLVFNFPPTTTSASFVLRKYYVSLLHHYEQVYFFGVQGKLVPPPAPLLASSPVHPSGDNGFDNSSLVEGGRSLKRRRKKKITFDRERTCGVEPGTSVGHTVTGVIDGKFEHGYLVTVTVGPEKLRGVLYHMPSGSMGPQFATVPILTGNGGSDVAPEVQQRRRRRRKDEMPKRDPNAPKLNRSGYNFFFQEQHLRLKALHPDKDKEISRMIGEQWNKLSEEEKAVYQERGVQDKERYKREMIEYREKLKTQVQGEGSGAGSIELVMQSREGSGQDKVDTSNRSAFVTREEETGQTREQKLISNSETISDSGDMNVSLEQSDKTGEKVSLGSSHDLGANG